MDDQLAIHARRAGLAIVIHDVDLDAGEGMGGAARLEGQGGQRRDHHAARLCLPPGIHDGAAAAADDVVVPLPGFGVDGLADGAEQAQATQVVPFHPIVAIAHEAADGGRRGIEDADAVFGDHAPVAIWCRVGGRPLVEEARRAQDERRVDDVGMAGDPAGVGRAPPAVFLFHIEDPAQRGGGIDLIAAVGMEDAFGLAGRAAGIEDEERVFGVHDFRFGVGPRLRGSH